MKSINLILTALVVCSSIGWKVQVKNAKVEHVKIYGKCEMCKRTIENAGNMKRLAEVVWDENTKMAKLTFDSVKTSKTEILKRIALAGYDSDSFFAPNDTYASLPKCCQYERLNKVVPIKYVEASKPEIEKPMVDHTSSHESDVVMAKSHPLAKVYEIYFLLKDALVGSDGAKASLQASLLLNEISAIKMESLNNDTHLAWMKSLKAMKEDAKSIADSKDLVAQRNYFMTLSNSIYGIMKMSKPEDTTYYQFCPMANDGKGANWLSKEKEIKNPYYGSQMLNCGKTVETLK